MKITEIVIAPVIAVTIAGCIGFGVRFVCPEPPRAATRPLRVREPRDAARHASGRTHFDVLAKFLQDDRRERKGWPASGNRVPSHDHPLLGAAAPDFVLADHQDQSRRLRDFTARGPVVLVFYLGYGCDACVQNLFELNADYDRFQAAGAEIIAVSGDAAALTRRRFAQYGAFRFPVLADPESASAAAFGLRRDGALHGTFIVGRDGKICWAWTGETPFRDNNALLCELEGAQAP